MYIYIYSEKCIQILTRRQTISRKRIGNILRMGRCTDYDLQGTVVITLLDLLLHKHCQCSQMFQINLYQAG